MSNLVLLPARFYMGPYGMDEDCTYLVLLVRKTLAHIAQREREIIDIFPKLPPDVYNVEIALGKVPVLSLDSYIPSDYQAGDYLRGLIERFELEPADDAVWVPEEVESVLDTDDGDVWMHMRLYVSFFKEGIDMAYVEDEDGNIFWILLSALVQVVESVATMQA